MNAPGLVDNRRPVAIVDPAPGQPLDAEALARLRRFHFGDPSAAPSPALVEPPAMPALLHALGEPAFVRSGFPYLLRVHSGGQARADSLTQVLRDALDAAFRGGGAPAVLTDNLLRVEWSIATRVRGAAGRIASVDVWDGLGAEIASALGLRSEVAIDLGVAIDRLAENVPSGFFVELGPDTTAELFQTAAFAAVTARRDAFRREIDRLRRALRARLEVERHKDYRAADAPPIDSAVGVSGRQMLDPSALRDLLARRSTGSLRLDPRRRARLEDALRRLDAFATGDAAPHVVVLGEPGTSFPTSDVTVEVCEDPSPCAAAMRRHAADAGGALEVFRAIRFGRLEADGIYDPERHDPWLDALDVSGLSEDERGVLPSVLVWTQAAALSGTGLSQLSTLLRSRLPIHVVARCGIEGPGRMTAELAYLGVAHREAYVQAGAAARPQGLLRGFCDGIASARPGLHVVADGHFEATGHIPPIGPFLLTNAAVESRVFPVFRYDPSAGESWARRFDLTDNPAVDAAWPSGPLRCREGAEGESVVQLEFTAIDFALLDPAWSGDFAVVPEGVDPTALTAVADALLFEDGDEIETRLPCIQGVDAEGHLVRLVVTRRLMAAAAEQTRYWRTLQELGGVRNEHVREAVEHARREADQRVDGLRQELESAHREELARVRRDAVREAMGGLARALLDVDAGQTVPATTLRAARVEPTPEPAAVESAPEADVSDATTPVTDEPEFDEPWIDTPLCTSCNDCRNLNPQLFVYDENKQARIGDVAAGTFREIVQAAEKCPARCIHPGRPQNPDEPDLAALIERAAPFQA